MIDLPKKRARYADERDELSHDLRLGRAHPKLSRATMLWVGLGTVVVGGAVSMYGANKQAKASAAANNTNASLQQQQNDQGWINYLATRGISPTTPISAGQMPTGGNYQAINTRLPLWAGMTAAPSSGSGGFLRKKGAPVSYSLGAPSLGGVPQVAPSAATSSGGGGGGIAALLTRPLNPRTAWDPIGLFG